MSFPIIAQMTASGAVVVEKLLDEECMDLVDLTADYGFSAPELYLQVGDDVAVPNDRAEALRAALESALRDRAIEVTISTEDKLDPDTVHRVCHVLRSGAVRLTRSSQTFIV